MRTALSHSVAGLAFLIPCQVYAHGDDEITVASFIGPAVAFLVFAAVVGLGKVLLRMITKRA